MLTVSMDDDERRAQSHGSVGATQATRRDTRCLTPLQKYKFVNWNRNVNENVQKTKTIPGIETKISIFEIKQ